MSHQLVTSRTGRKAVAGERAERRGGRGCASCTGATCRTRHAHYAGNLVDGAYWLGLFGDVATEVCIRTDGDEGLFASYSDVQFRAPVRAGDVPRGDRRGGRRRAPVADPRLHG